MPGDLRGEERIDLLAAEAQIGQDLHGVLEPGHRLHERVVAREGGPAAGGAEGAGVAVHGVRVQAGDGLGVDAQTLRYPDAEVVQDDVGPRQQPLDVAALLRPAQAVATGRVRHAVIWRTVKEGSASRQAGGRPAYGTTKPVAEGPLAWLLPVGMLSPVCQVAPYAARYMHEYGVTREQLAWIP